VLDNRHLITKMVFPSEVLPVINFLVASVPHLALLLGMCVVLAFANLLAMDKVFWVIYFYVCTAYIALGASWLAASVCVFSRDAAPS
jgi:ABC-type polysaccharide/polyol phosphate export permease